MATNTTPDGIRKIDGTDGVGFVTDMGLMADSVQTAFNNVYQKGGFRTYASAAARNAAIPTPALGYAIYRSDLNAVERYYTTAFASTAGWYKESGSVTTRNRTSALTVNSTVAVTDFNVATESPTQADFSYSAGSFTCIRAGRYQAKTMMNMAAAGAVVGYLARITKNGTVMASASMVTSTVAGTGVFVSYDVPLVAGDVVAVQNFAGAGIGIDPAAGNVYIQLTFLGA